MAAQPGREGVQPPRKPIPNPADGSDPPLPTGDALPSSDLTVATPYARASDALREIHGLLDAQRSPSPASASARSAAHELLLGGLDDLRRVFAEALEPELVAKYGPRTPRFAKRNYVTESADSPGRYDALQVTAVSINERPTQFSITVRPSADVVFDAEAVLEDCYRENVEPSEAGREMLRLSSDAIDQLGRAYREIDCSYLFAVGEESFPAYAGPRVVGLSVAPGDGDTQISGNFFGQPDDTLFVDAPGRPGSVKRAITPRDLAFFTVQARFWIDRACALYARFEALRGALPS